MRILGKQKTTGRESLVPRPNTVLPWSLRVLVALPKYSVPILVRVRVTEYGQGSTTHATPNERSPSQPSPAHTCRPYTAGRRTQAADRPRSKSQGSEGGQGGRGRRWRGGLEGGIQSVPRSVSATARPHRRKTALYTVQSLILDHTPATHAASIWDKKNTIEGVPHTQKDETKHSSPATHCHCVHIPFPPVVNRQAVVASQCAECLSACICS